jgi:predicted ester cyclase
VWDGGNFDVIPELVTDDFVFHNPMLDEPAHGPVEYPTLVEGFHDSFSDMEHEVDEMYAVDEVVVTRYTTRATHDGELEGIAPTGTKIEVTGIVIDHLKDGKLAERYVNDDALGLFEQIGAVEPPTESEPTV